MIHRFQTKQILNGNVEKIWEYISRPHHLEYLTPPWMRFEILNKNEFDNICNGLKIEYKIKAFPYFPYRYHWITQVLDVIENKSFVYQQINGPYKYWQHKIELVQTNDINAVELLDEYEYIMPYGFIGNQMNKYIVKDLLAEITNYRRDKLASHFPASHH